MAEDKKKYFAELLNSFQRGDRSALESLCRVLEKDIRGYSRQKFTQPEVVDDLAQETYIRLMRNLPNVREPMKLRSFVVKVAVHVSQDYLRQKYRKKEESLEDRLTTGADTDSRAFAMADRNSSPERILDQMDLQKALDELPKKTRQIVLMKADGYKYEEIAENLGLRVSGVKMQVKRSFEKLRVSLAGVTFLLFVTTILMRESDS